MDDEELHTWLNMVTEKVNDCPLILGAPQGITPNHILLGFRKTHGEEVDLEVQVQHQLIRWQTCLSVFYSLWIQEFTRRRFNMIWKNQTITPKVGGHRIIQERTHLQTWSLCRQNHPAAPEKKQWHIWSYNWVQERSWSSCHVHQQKSPSSLPLHGCRDCCSPRKWSPASGRMMLQAPLLQPLFKLGSRARSPALKLADKFTSFNMISFILNFFLLFKILILFFFITENNKLFNIFSIIFISYFRPGFIWVNFSLFKNSYFLKSNFHSQPKIKVKFI